MNEILTLLKNRQSVRQFENKPIEAEKLAILADVFSQAPTSINGQLVSLVIIQDPEKKKRISQLVGDQQHVIDAPVFMAFCLDIRRAERMLKKANLNFDNKYTWDMVLTPTYDAGSKMSHIQIAAQSLGIEGVPIGSLRRNVAEVCQLLNLPEGVYPFCGLALGYASSEVIRHTKPKLPKHLTVFHEEYQITDIDKELEAFDEAVRQYHIVQYGSDQIPQTKAYKSYYETEHYPSLEKSLIDQGFLKK